MMTIWSSYCIDPAREGERLVNWESKLRDVRFAVANADSGFVRSWIVDPAGNGVLYVRAAKVGRPDLVETQLTRLVAWCGEHDATPRALVVASGMSAWRPLDGRNDLQAVLVQVQNGCTWIAAANGCVVARRCKVLLEFTSRLRDVGAELYLQQFGGEPLVGELLLGFLGRMAPAPPIRKS
jgi:hypothetical protein